MTEKKLQITFVLASIVFLIAGLIVYQFDYNLSYLLLVFFFAIVVSALISEMYFRIQHNLDQNLKVSEYLEKETRSSEQINQKINILEQKFNSELVNLKGQLNNSKSSEQINQKINILEQKFNSELVNLKGQLNNSNKQTQTQISELEDKNRLNIIELDKKLTKLSEGNINATDKFFWHYVKENRASHLADLAPKLFKCKSVLYVGARIDRSDFLSNFKNSGSKITVLEIHKPNVNYFKIIPWLFEVIEGDVTKFKSKTKYDVVFWWHGPEHIEKSKLPETLKNLESMAKKTVVLGCPWGNVPQGGNLEKENPYEKHVSYFDVGEFEKFGYKADYSGLKNNPGSNIIAVKIVK